MHKVFVYGTLKRGNFNHVLLSRVHSHGKAAFQYEGVIEDVALVNSSGFPYMVENKGFHAFGEVYQVDDYTLQELDYLEGYPFHYQRKQFEAKDIETGKKEEVLAYYLEPTKNKEKIEELIDTYGLTTLWEQEKSISRTVSEEERG